MTEVRDVSPAVVAPRSGEGPRPKRWALAAIVSLVLASSVGVFSTNRAWSADAKKKAAGAPATPARQKVNACGCYKDPAGSCLCGRKGKCGCPGDCEPRGCEEKRAKDMEREIKAETKRAQEAEKHQKAATRKRPDDEKSAKDTKGGDKGHAKKGDSARE